MAGRWDSFVVFAEMRTGSNFLEENLNDYPGLHCYGEVFNPHFVGHANRRDLLGISMAERDADPGRLLDRMKLQTGGLPGFRFFHDHDPRVLARCLPDPRCAKIVLTRNPIDSYVSRKIARATGQWRLGDMKAAKVAQVTFDAAEFEEHLGALQEFQVALLNGLQTTGQTAFYIAYDDLRDIAVLNGLATWLGVDADKKRTSQATKVQNPAPLTDKVVNFDEMQTALGSVDRFDLTRTPNFEPRRPPAVPSYVAAATAPLLFLPLKAGPEERLYRWLVTLDGVEPGKLQTGFNQKSLRQWKRTHPGHRSFAVLRHPVLRLHQAFVTHILLHGEQTFWEIRRTLREAYKLPIPEEAPGADFDAAQHRRAFLAFAKFVRGNLNGQTSLRTDQSWATQTAVLQGIAQIELPDMLLREDRLDEGLGHLATEIGLTAPPAPLLEEPGPYRLADIYDEEVEEAVKEVYRRDYLMFGFRSWR